ncbi:MAG: hypothetical protein H8D32_03980 [Dehalococcoidia bacterium]|nr:hypothetical protein [Dehalococcoidia bacterium]
MGKLSAGIVLATLILTGVLVKFTAPPEVGIVIIAVAVIWGLLALPSWGPLRRRWDSKPARTLSVENWGDYQFGSPEKNGFAKAIEGESLMLRIEVGFRAIPNMCVKSVQLEIGRKRLLSNWEPCEIHVGGGYGCSVYFGIPKWVKAGKHNVKLVAFADGKDWFSGDFTVEFPKQD